MQAGVPMIPIVIRNAGDVAPKGDFVFRAATVDVEVLPPVDTSKWRSETVEDHVREVRNMFARTLGQPELKPPARKSRSRPAAKKKASAKRKTPEKAKSKAKTKGKATRRSGGTRTKSAAGSRPGTGARSRKK